MRLTISGIKVSYYYYNSTHHLNKFSFNQRIGLEIYIRVT